MSNTTLVAVYTASLQAIHLKAGITQSDTNDVPGWTLLVTGKFFIIVSSSLVSKVLALAGDVAAHGRGSWD